MLGARSRCRQTRRRHAVDEPSIVLGPRHIGRMRQHEAHREREGLQIALAASLADLVELGQGGRAAVLVQQLIGALSGARAIDADPVRVVGLGEHAHVVPRHARPVRRVVAYRPLHIAVQLIWPQGVKPPCEHRPMAAGAQGVGECRDVRGQHVLVGPHVLAAGMARGQHRHARRRADGRGRVTALEQHATTGQPVQIGRLGHIVAVAAGDTLRVLIREDEEKIRTALAHALIRPGRSSGASPRRDARQPPPPRPRRRRPPGQR